MPRTATYPTGSAQRFPVSQQRIVELVDSRRADSIRYNQRVFSKVLNWYQTFRGIWQQQTSQFRNNLSIPFTFAMIQSDVARKVQTSFGAWPIVSFEGYAPEDIPHARKREVLISAQMKDCGSVVRAADFFLQADICGTAIARYGWKHTVRRRRVTRNEMVAPGFSIPVVREYDAEIFNGPTWEVVDRLDFWQQPAKKRIEDMAWVIHRYWLDLDDMMEDVRNGSSYFDEAGVRQLMDTPLSTPASIEFNARRLTFRSEYDYMARSSERFAKPVEIWEMHGTVPEEFTTDGIRERCIAIGNGRVVLKNRPSVLPSGKKMFESFCPTPDPYGFDGIGKAEIADRPQRIADRIANQKLDALDLLIDPMWLMNSAAAPNRENLFTRAGRVFLMDGPVDDTNIRSLQPDMRGLQAAYQEIGQLYQFMQIGTGETEATMGQPGSGRETARGFLGRQENALGRLGLESRLAEEGFVEPLANAFVELNRQFLPLPYQAKVLGSIASTNPITGLPLPQERVSIDEDDLASDYRARAIGATQMMGRSLRQQNFMGLFQILSSNPAMAGIVNWTNFARQAFELFDFKNIEELLVTQQNMVNMQAMQALGGNQQAAPGNPSTSLEQLSPETLGQFLNTQNPAPMAA
jgi:hypothetical protein